MFFFQIHFPYGLLQDIEYNSLCYAVVVVVVAKSCPTLLWPMDYSLLCSSVRDFPGKNTGAGCQVLLQGIFQTQGSNPGLPHCG